MLSAAFLNMREDLGLRVAVLQPGARLHYAVPAVLARAGILQRFYTDFANTGMLRTFERLWPPAMQPARVRRLLGRKLPGDISPHQVRQVRAAVLRDLAMRSLQPASPATSSAALMDLARRESFGGAGTIYTVLVNEDIDLLREAKRDGRRIVHEVMITPDVALLTHDAFRQYARAGAMPSLRDIHVGRARDRMKYQMADLILTPSHFVREAVLALGADPAKVCVVPYGIDGHWLQRPSRPVPGRVLFVGSIGLRKGNHHLAAAARLLAQRRVDCEVRVVGPHDGSIAQRSILAGPTYVGQVPRADVHREFVAADVFVLPSLAEGMAVVTLEALAMGLPVITTPNAGSCVRDGIDGLIVPAGDDKALAHAIEQIVTDRRLREAMSHNARQRAAEFTWTHYERRLLKALGSLSHATDSFGAVAMRG
jgi:glycosyltransferase involved in cell wall biosynthesis